MQKTTRQKSSRHEVSVKCSHHVIALLLLLCRLNLSSCDKQAAKTIPKLLVISFGAFRWDYLTTAKTTRNESSVETLNYLQSIGSHADYVTNNFVTDSLSNQWSIVTGLNQETHGMIQNEMFDANTKSVFSIENGSIGNEWFGHDPAVEPIWISNQKADKERHSLVGWAGGEYSWDGQTAYRLDSNGLAGYTELVGDIIKAMDRTENQVNFGLVYLNALDRIGHKYGPFSAELTKELKTIDTKFVKELIEQLKFNKLFDQTHLIFTSDHGMVNVSKETTIILDKYVNTALFDCYGGATVLNVFVKNSSDINRIHKTLSGIENLTVYSRSEIPEALRYKESSRTGDIVLIAKYGYTISRKEPASYLKGAHGYDGNVYSSMNSIFIGVGPYFRKNVQIDPFRIVDLYPLMCALLEIEPRPNNGSLENVKSMLLIMSAQEKQTYIIVSLVPVTLSIIAAFVLCLMSRRKAQGKGKNHLDLDGYKMLSMKEDIADLDSESEDYETEIFRQT